MVTVRLARREEWDAGIDVVLAAQISAALPDASVVSAEELAVHTRQRQESALGVWVAVDGAEVLGHGLVTHAPEDHPFWSQFPDPDVRSALSRQLLYTLGGLAVHPQATRRGIGRALVRERLTFAFGLGQSVVGSSIWRESVGSRSLALEYGRLAMELPGEVFDLYLYDSSKLQRR